MNPLFHRIMIACDLSKMDEKLIKCAGSLAQSTGIQKIFLVHVTPYLSQKYQQKSPSNSDGIYPMDEKIRFDLAEKARKQIGTWSIDIETVVLKGHVYNQLLEFTKKKFIDLLILGRKDSEKGSGSMSKRLARNIDSSVLFLTNDNSQSLDSVLVPIDFSKYSAKALQTAIQYKKNMEIPIKVKGLHITEVSPLIAELNLLGKGITEDEQLMKTERSYQEFLNKNNIDEMDLERVIVAANSNRVRETIYSDYMKENSKLIIIGAKGQSAIEQYFYEGFTEQLVEDTGDFPLLVVR